MKTVTINKQNLIAAIEERFISFGDPFLGLYVDVTGDISCVDKNYSGDLMPVLTFAGMGDFQDDSGVYADNENYDASSVAQYIVEKGGCLTWSGTLLDDAGSEVKYKFEII